MKRPMTVAIIQRDVGADFMHLRTYLRDVRLGSGLLETKLYFAKTLFGVAGKLFKPAEAFFEAVETGFHDPS